VEAGSGEGRVDYRVATGLNKFRDIGCPSSFLVTSSYPITQSLCATTRLGYLNANLPDPRGGLTQFVD
jgi:hypothetical protein